MNMYTKTKEKFIEDYIKNGTTVDKEQLVEVMNEMESLIYNNKDKTLEEIITLLLENVNQQLSKIMTEYSIPGYNLEINSGRLNANTYGGYLNHLGTSMSKNALFDVASITKLFTQIISYNLIKEGYYKPDSIVSELHPAFENATELDIRTIMEFTFSYKINGKIETAETVEGAKEILYSLGKNESKYVYNDFGMMCLKEVMEKVTGKTYEQLVNEYIVNKLNLKNTYLTVPEEKISLITGTPNAHLGLNNDMKSIKLGGYSGNAGILASSEDLIRVVKNLYTNNNFFPLEKLSDAYIESAASIADDHWYRGTMGNACTPGGSFIGKYSPYNTSAYQGSTRTQANIGIYNGNITASTFLLNPNSMSKDQLRELEIKNGKKYLVEYKFGEKDYSQIASQLIVPTSVVKDINIEISKLSLKMSFLNTLADAYEPNYTKDVKVDVFNGTLVKQK